MARRHAHGFVLLSLLIVLTMGSLYFLVDQLTPALVESIRQHKTHAALKEAKAALLGYALKYREQQGLQDADFTGSDDEAMYGHLPLPDLGSSRNNNQLTDSACFGLEGCEAYNFSGNGANVTVIGRFPWRSLGTGPLRDGHGECLWYAVSGSHQRNQATLPMSWDTLGHLDIVVANNSTELASSLASLHERPIAIIFSPGPALPGQDRSNWGVDNVTECGGNYHVANYLDPGSVALGASTNYFASENYQDSNGRYRYASGATATDTPKAFSVQGKVYSEDTGGIRVELRQTCSSSTANCKPAANDLGLALTSHELFSSLHRRQNFLDDLNGLIDKIDTCLRSDSANGLLPNPANTDANGNLLFAQPPTIWSLGRLPDSASGCYSNSAVSPGYFNSYRDQLFYAKCLDGSACLTASTNLTASIPQACAAVLVFSGQRGSGQSRATTSERNTLANYLEGENLTSLTAFSATSFSGQYRLQANLSAAQDIVRCIPDATNAAPLTLVSSPTLPADKQLASFNAGTMTLTLGSSATTGTGYPAASLFGCAWGSETPDLGSGMRAYFRFKIPNTGDGFTFALADGDLNFGTAASPSWPCGMSGQHLGYSGDNGITPYINSPKIVFEIDTSRNAGYSSTSNILTSGRNDPCYTSSCGGQGLSGNGHVGIVYWGYETANAFAPTVTIPRGTDNIHGFPLANNPPGRPAPQNPVPLVPYPSLTPPDPPPGVAPFPSLTGGTVAGRDFHARMEITRSYSGSGDAADRKGTYTVQMWILQQSATVANQIAAMKNVTRPMSQLYPTFKAKIYDQSTIYDVAVGACSAQGLCSGPARLKQSACAADKSCPAAQSCGADNYCYLRLNTCGSDNVCYQEALHSVRPGFTIGQRTNDQQIEISDFTTSWQP